jgi:hypothetical protein
MSDFAKLGHLTPSIHPAVVRIQTGDAAIADVDALYILDTGATLRLPELDSVTPGYRVNARFMGSGTILAPNGSLLHQYTESTYASFIALDEWLVCYNATNVPHRREQAKLVSSGSEHYFNFNHITDVCVKVDQSPDFTFVLTPRVDNYPTLLEITSWLSVVKLKVLTGVVVVDQAADVNQLVYKSSINSNDARLQLIHIGNNRWKVLARTNWVTP